MEIDYAIFEDLESFGKGRRFAVLFGKILKYPQNGYDLASY